MKTIILVFLLSVMAFGQTGKSNLTQQQKDSIGAMIRDSSGYVTPENYGAVGDGVTDDTEALQSAFDNGNIIKLHNKIYLTSSALSINSDKTILSDGAIILSTRGANGYIIDVNPYYPDANALPTGSQYLLSDDAEEGNQGVTLSSENAANFSKGDYVIVRSTKDFNTFNVGYKQGEMHSVRNSSNGYVQFNEPLNDTYLIADGVYLQKAPLLNFNVVGNLTLQHNPADSSVKTYGLKLLWCNAPTLNISTINCQEISIAVYNCYKPNLDVNITNSNNKGTGIGYGVSIAGYTCYGRFTGSAFYARHAIAVGGNAIWGVSWNNLVYNFTGVQGWQDQAAAVFDAHEYNGRITYQNCTAISDIDGGSTGFALGGSYLNVIDCEIRGGLSGIGLRAGSYDVKELYIKNLKSYNVRGSVITLAGGGEVIDRLIIDGVYATKDSSFINNTSNYAAILTSATVNEYFSISNITCLNMPFGKIGGDVPDNVTISDIKSTYQALQTGNRQFSNIGFTGINEVHLDNISISNQYVGLAFPVSDISKIYLSNVSINSTYYCPIYIERNDTLDILSITNSSFDSTQAPGYGVVYLGKPAVATVYTGAINTLILNNNTFDGFTTNIIADQSSTTPIVNYFYNGINKFSVTTTKNIISDPVGTIEILSGGYSNYNGTVSNSFNRIYRGSGEPEGNFSASQGTVYIRTDGGLSSTLYIKSVGDGTKGWTRYLPTDGWSVTEDTTNNISVNGACDGVYVDGLAPNLLAGGFIVPTEQTGISGEAQGFTSTYAIGQANIGFVASDTLIAGDNYIISFYAKRISGADADKLRVYIEDTYYSDSFIITDDWVRYSLQFTPLYGITIGTRVAAFGLTNAGKTSVFAIDLVSIMPVEYQTKITTSIISTDSTTSLILKDGSNKNWKIKVDTGGNLSADSTGLN